MDDATPLRGCCGARTNSRPSRLRAALAAALPEPVLRSADHLAQDRRPTLRCAKSQAWPPTRSLGGAFAPVFVTVDTLVVCAKHVLLVQRGLASKACWPPSGSV